MTEDEPQCLICLESISLQAPDFPDDPNGRITLPCTHSFHGECLKGNVWSQAAIGLPIDIINNSEEHLFENLRYQKIPPSCPACRRTFIAGTYWPSLVFADYILDSGEEYVIPNPNYEPPDEANDSADSFLENIISVRSIADLNTALAFNSPITTASIEIPLASKDRERVQEALRRGILHSVFLSNGAALDTVTEEAVEISVHINQGGRVEVVDLTDGWVINNGGYIGKVLDGNVDNHKGNIGIIKDGTVRVFEGEVGTIAGGVINIYEAIARYVTGGEISAYEGADINYVIGGVINLNTGASVKDLAAGEVYVHRGGTVTLKANIRVTVKQGDAYSVEAEGQPPRLQIKDFLGTSFRLLAANGTVLYP